MYPWIEIFIIIFLIFIIYKIYKPKNIIILNIIKNTIQKFKDICDIVELNMMVEDSESL